MLREVNFAIYLEQRLRLLARREQDEKYKTFLNNLRHLVLKPETRSALSTIDKKSSVSTEPSRALQETSTPVALIQSLKKAFVDRGALGVDAQVFYAYNGVLARRDNIQIGKDVKAELLDLRYPSEWYFKARAISRKFHLHIGPTNSGKTYHALKALGEARTGVFAGPLRLLAHEVYSRLNARGQKCDLLTGDEQILIEGKAVRKKSCTVEMVPLGVKFDVAVIDEIQMMADNERGWAWTQALLGLQAKEIHLCGEERSLPLVRDLVASVGDTLEVHRYHRLTPLKTMSTSLRGDFQNLRKGDCVVAFSRVRLHALKRQIELATQKRVAIVYGSLPPEIRAQQARLFNDESNDYDYLVASDAIGMGLNLSVIPLGSSLLQSKDADRSRAIKRIIFETVVKSNGFKQDLLSQAQIKQIAGRAGRYRTASQSLQESASSGISQDKNPVPNLSVPAIGLVTTLEEQDLPIVRKAMEVDMPPLLSAGILPPSAVILEFARRFPPSISFSYILERLKSLALQHPRFHFCSLRNLTFIANCIEPVKGLSNRDRLLFCYAPSGDSDVDQISVLQGLARCVADGTSGEFLKIPEIKLEILDEPVQADQDYRSRLESLHKAVTLYLWLSYRFPGCFIDQAMAFYAKHLIEKRLDDVLVEFSASPVIMRKIKSAKAAARRFVEMGQDTEDEVIDPTQSERAPSVKPEEPIEELSTLLEDAEGSAPRNQEAHAAS